MGPVLSRASRGDRQDGAWASVVVVDGKDIKPPSDLGRGALEARLIMPPTSLASTSARASSRLDAHLTILHLTETAGCLNPSSCHAPRPQEPPSPP